MAPSRSPSMDRRQFLSAAATGALALATVPRALAGQSTKYDLLIRGGRVIDPSARLDGVADVAILGGRIAAVDANLAGDATQIIDARGKLVVPGLIDIHCHALRSAGGAALILRDGVTGFIDA